LKIFPSTVINFHTIYDYHWMDNIFNLLKRMYNIVPLSELESYYYEENKRLSNACHITFDDGDVSFYEIVYPLLKKHNLPVSIFVSPKVAKEQTNFWFQEISNYDEKKLLPIIVKNCNLNPADIEGKPINAIMKSLPLDLISAIINQYQHDTKTQIKPPMNMTVNQIKEINNSGLVTLGAHTLNHPILKNESDERCRIEIKHSVEELSNLIENEVICFAYPNGKPFVDYDQREINYLRDSTIKLAFSTENRRISKSDQPLSIPRNGISHGSSSFVITKLLAGKRWDILKRLLKGKLEEDYRKELVRKICTYST